MPRRRASALPVKLTRPDTADVRPRTELLARLSSLLDAHAAVWIAAAAGSGKTTLLSQLAAERSCLWYQVDAADLEPETFFHYLTLAARDLDGRRARALPHSGTEYASDLGAFASRLFERLYGGLPAGTLVVLDDVHVFESPRGEELLSAAIEHVPAHVRLVLASRHQPPPALARHVVNRRIALLDGDALLLSLGEARAVLEQRAGGALDDETARRVHAATRGWVAGLVLLAGELEKGTALEPGSALLFDYLAAELMGGLEPATQDLLLVTSVAPRLTPRIAETLTGDRHAHARLEELHRKQRLVQRRPGREPFYEYHPLFRRFLAERATATLDPERLRTARRQAAELLEASGEVNEAGDLLLEGDDFQALVALLLRQAPRLEKERRWSTLARWIRALPDEERAKEPWLSYWLGLARLASDTVEARRCFVQAYEAFRASRERTGAYLAWARVVECIILEYGSFHDLDRWIDELSALKADLGFSLSVEAFVRVSVSLFDALLHRQPHHPDVQDLAVRLRRTLSIAPDVNARMLLGAFLMRYYAWAGELASARSLLTRLTPHAASPEVEPVVRTVWTAMESVYAWFLGSPAEGVRGTHKALDVARETGIHFLDFRILVQGAYSALALGDLDEAQAFLEKMPETFRPERHLDMGQHVWIIAWAELARGDVESGLSHMQEALEVAESIGVPYVEARALHGLAQAWYRAGAYDEARACLERMGVIAGAGAFPVVRYARLLSEAELAFAADDVTAGRARLAEAFALGAQKGYQAVPHWTPAQLAALSARALEADIERGYARAIVRTQGLHAHLDEAPVEGWPWPVELRVLGTASLQVDGAPVDARTAAGKPFDLLKAIVAFGGSGVHEQTLAEALWPDADGDRGRDALKTTLSRLRKLIGSEAVEVIDRRLSLDASTVFVDALVLDRLLERYLAMPRFEDPEAALSRVTALYRGPFLSLEPELSWAIPLRDRVHSRFLRLVERAGRELEEKGRPEAALDAYRRGLEIAPTSEVLHQGVIRCCRALERPGDALFAFERCSQQLEHGLGVPPSADTRALVLDLLR